MAKRRADKELNHDNWNVEEDEPQETGGIFKRASDKELARRVIKVAKRRSDGITTGGSDSPSVFKNFSGFGSLGGGNTAPSFEFGSSKLPSPDTKNMFESSSFKMGMTLPTSASTFSFTTSNCDKENSEPSDKNKSSNRLDESNTGKSTGGTSANIEGNNTAYLARLKMLNESVLQWIQKHLDENSNINLIPVFDDYRSHFDDLERRYKPKFSKSGSISKKAEPEESATKKNGSASSVKQTQLASSSSDFSFKSSVQSESKISASPKDSENKPSVFSSGSSDTKITESPETKSKGSVGFSFNLSPKDSTAAALFSFGSSSAKSNEPSSSSFASSDSKPKESIATGFGASTEKAGFSFGASSAPLTFGAKEGGFSFGSAASASTFSFAPTGAPPVPSSTKPEEDEDTPPKPEVVEVKEEGALYEKKCKLFYKKDGVFTDKGVGTIFLKSAGEGSKKTQLIIRAATNLGNVLLNIVLNSSLPTQRMGKNNVLIVCVPNPPIDPKGDNNTPVTMLIRVKTAEDADELLKKIDQHKGD